MGDADVTQIMMPVQELEEVMEDALNEVDEEMSRLFTFMSFLTEQCARVSAEIYNLRKYQRSLIALNLLVVPIVLAIGIAYATIGLAELNPTIEDGLQMLITSLMYISGSIGLPFYIFTLWEPCVTGLREFCKTRASDAPIKEKQSISEILDSRCLSMANLQESFETISEFRRIAGRNRNAFRRNHTDHESQHETMIPPREAQNVTMGSSTDSEEEEVTRDHSNERNTRELRDYDDLSRECARLSNEMRNETTLAIEALQNGEKCLFDMKLINLSSAEDLTSESTKKEDSLENTPAIGKENFSDVTRSQPTRLRDIVIETVGEGDCSTPVFQHNTNADFKHNRSEQIFGL